MVHGRHRLGGLRVTPDDVVDQVFTPRERAAPWEARGRRTRSYQDQTDSDSLAGEGDWSSGVVVVRSRRGGRCRRPAGEVSVEEENQRLCTIEVELDQCWDLLRQRRPKRELGEDPAAPEVRDPEVVESYRG
jgi:hypothetical protein